MLDLVLSTVARISRWPILLLLLAMTLVFALVLMPMFMIIPQNSQSSTPALDLLFSYDPQTAFLHVESLGEAGRRLSAVMHMTLDIAYPIVYSMLLAVMLFMSTRYVCQSPLWQRRTKWLPILPFIILDLDILENIAISALLLSWPKQHIWLAQLSSLASSGKWIMIGIVIGLVLVFLLLAGVKRVGDKGMKKV